MAVACWPGAMKARRPPGASMRWHLHVGLAPGAVRLHPLSGEKSTNRPRIAGLTGRRTAVVTARPCRAPTSPWPMGG
jgi:hypothetical protein